MQVFSSDLITKLHDLLNSLNPEIMFDNQTNQNFSELNLELIAKWQTTLEPSHIKKLAYQEWHQLMNIKPSSSPSCYLNQFESLPKDPATYANLAVIQNITGKSLEQLQTCSQDEYKTLLQIADLIP